MTFYMKCSNEHYKLLHPYYYPTNHTQAGVTSARPCISKIYMEPQKNPHSNSDPAKEQSWRIHAT